MARAVISNQARAVSESNSSTYEYLLSHYGPLLTLKHLAEVMHTTPAGLRMTLARGRQPMSVGLASPADSSGAGSTSKRVESRS